MTLNECKDLIADTLRIKGFSYEIVHSVVEMFSENKDLTLDQITMLPCVTSPRVKRIALLMGSFVQDLNVYAQAKGDLLRSEVTATLSGDRDNEDPEEISK